MTEGRAQGVVAVLIGAALLAGAGHSAVRARAEQAPTRAGGSVFAVSADDAGTTRVSSFAGRDLDNDGAADFANPTGEAPRDHDSYGDGEYGASRDGGAREHAGVDYRARAGQTVVAPISGYVVRIGHAYADDQTLRYVEIANPALNLTARVFYVRPDVDVGEAVRIGRGIGRAETLQDRYPGITDHVHLELRDGGRPLDAERVIVARLQPKDRARG